MGRNIISIRRVMSNSQICETIVVTKTDPNANICAGEYDFDTTAREWIHTTQPECRIGKYLDFDTGTYKWRGYLWTDINEAQPAGSSKKAQFSIPPTVVAYTDYFTEQSLGNYYGTGNLGLPDHTSQFHDASNPGCDYSYYPAPNGTPVSTQSIVYSDNPHPEEDPDGRAGIKWAKKHSDYWGEEPEGSTDPEWALEHHYLYDNPSKPTESTGEWWIGTNTAGIGHFKGAVINVYVLDENMGVTNITGGSYLPYRKATVNDGKLGDTFFAHWAGGIEWKYNNNSARAEFENRNNSSVPQNFPFFFADGVDGAIKMNSVFNGSTQDPNNADTFSKNFLSSDICTLLNNYYGGSTDYNKFVNHKDHFGLGFERMWLGATFSMFEEGSMNEEVLEVKVITDNWRFENWIENGTHGDCAGVGWFEETGIETDSNMHELCPTEADWSGTGIGVSLPSSNPPSEGPTNIDAQQDGGGGGGGGTVVPVVGPTNLNAQDTTIVAPISGPTGTTAVVQTPSETFTGDTLKPKYLGYVFDERTDGVSGPFASEHVTTITTKDNSAEMLCVNEEHEVKKTDLLEFNNAVFPKFSDPFGDILVPFDTTTEKGVVCSKTGEGFLYRGRYMSAPFEEPVDGPGTVTNPLFFKDSHLAIAETNWLHLGDEHNEKQCYRVDLSFRKNSCGYLWLFVKGEDEKVKGQYKGKIKEHMKVFTNLRGRCFRIQMFVATHNDHPWAMREMAIGHLYGKSF
jgi:hypothetical protein